MTTPPPPPGWGPPPPHGQPYAPQPQSSDVLWSVLAHLSIFGLAFVAPLAIYLVLKDSQPFVRQHAAEALNFHLTLLLMTIVAGILVIVLVGILLLLAVGVFGVVMGIIAAVAAANRQPYRYPLTIHFVK